MTMLPPSHVEDELRHLAQQFAQWRHSRTTPRGRIPKPLWAQAATLARVLPCARVAKQLGVTPQALKRRRDATSSTLAPTPSLPAPHFVEVAAAGRMPTTEVEVQQPNGTRLRITYHDASPALVPLLQTFLETR